MIGMGAEAWGSVWQGAMAILASPQAWVLIFVGVVLGMVVGVLPGFGPPAAMALLFPLVYTMPPLEGISLLAGIFYGAKYGGAVTSILIGIPGEADAVATLLEGYPLAQAGHARGALRVAIGSSFVGGMLSIMGMVLLAPFLGKIALFPGPLGQVMIMVGALGLMVFFHQGGWRGNFFMILLGLILSLIGLDDIHAVPRLVFGRWELLEGLNLGALLLGMYGLGDIFHGLLCGTQPRPVDQNSLRPIDKIQLGEFTGSATRGAIIGFGFGMIPSGAGMTASFASYALERKLSPSPHLFGTGQWTGLAGPEASNNAAAIGSFAPLLLLGLPTNPVMAAMLGALTIGGVVPGPRLPEVQPHFYWGLIAGLALGNCILLVLGLGLVRVWSALARMPYGLIWPLILILCLAGSWFEASSMWGPIQCILFGVLSLVLRRHGFSPAPMVLAFVLGPRLEIVLVQTLIGF